MLNFFKKAKDTKESLLSNEKSSRRARFHSLRVSDITRETSDCISVAFEVPENLVDDYTFIPGQYLTLEKEIGGEKIRRSYSLCSSPVDGELRVAIKQVPGGKFSTFANTELSVGDMLDVMTPEGKFYTKLDPANKKNYVAFAAGSGITPIFSIMKSVMAIEPNSTFTLFFGNKTTQSVMFRDAIDALKNTHMNRLEVHHILSREDQGTDMLKGHLDEAKCISFSQKYFNINKVDEYFICGPEAMINCINDSLLKLGADKAHVHYELFTSPSQNIAHKTKVSAEKKSTELTSAVTIILDGEETHFEIASNGKNVL